MAAREHRWLTRPAVQIAVVFSTLIGGASALGLPTDIWHRLTDEGEAIASADEIAAAELGCGSMEDSAVIEGSLGVANVTEGDSAYDQSIHADPGETIRFQIFLRNREVSTAVENLRARLVQRGNPFEHILELQACGSNTRLLQWSTTVRSPDTGVDLAFQPGTVNIRTIIGGEPVDRGGSDQLVGELGESLGRLPAAPDEGENLVTITVLADSVSRPSSDEGANDTLPASLDDVGQPPSAVSRPTAGWGPGGPERPVLDWNDPADRGGFVDGPHFNSITNAPVYGQEMSFVDAKAASELQAGGFQNELSNVSGRYLVRAYVENGANDFIDPAIGTAANTRLAFRLPGGTANGFDVGAYITADNAIPHEIYDVVTFRNDQRAFDIDYVPGSARIFNGEHPAGLVLDDEIVGDGILIGSSEMDGRMPAGYLYSAYITIEVEIRY